MPHQNEPNGAPAQAVVDSNDQDDAKLLRFLLMIRLRARDFPMRIWGAQVRRALSDDLVKVGWGGVLELTDAGRAAICAGDA